MPSYRDLNLMLREVRAHVKLWDARHRVELVTVPNYGGDSMSIAWRCPECPEAGAWAHHIPLREPTREPLRTYLRTKIDRERLTDLLNDLESDSVVRLLNAEPNAYYTSFPEMIHGVYKHALLTGHTLYANENEPDCSARVGCYDCSEQWVTDPLTCPGTIAEEQFPGLRFQWMVRSPGGYPINSMAKLLVAKINQVSGGGENIFPEYWTAANTVEAPRYSRFERLLRE